MANAPTPAADGTGRMFDRIASRYDLLNRVISLGADQSWRRLAVASLDPASAVRVLDLATGTGDIALRVARTLPGSRVTGVDPSQGMLEVARRKTAEQGLADRVDYVVGDGLAIPFGPGTFDAALMAFGIRNVPDRPTCLKELVRVVRPGGRVAILELAEPRGHSLSFAARAWKRHVVPRIGALVASAAEYAYLDESIRSFPPSHEFARMMEAAGFADVACTSLTFGAAVLFTGAVAGASP